MHGHTRVRMLMINFIATLVSHVLSSSRNFRKNMFLILNSSVHCAEYVFTKVIMSAFAKPFCVSSQIENLQKEKGPR